MNPVEARFRRLAFFQVLLGILAFAIAEGQPVMLMGVGLMCVMAWFVTEGPRPSGLPRALLNAGALLAVGLVLVEFRVTGGARPVALVGHLTMALQVLLLFGKRGKREYAQLAVLSPLQMISASVLPGGVTLIYGLLLILYCALTLMTALAAQVNRAGDLVHDRHRKGAAGMEGQPDGKALPTTGARYRLHRGVVTLGVGAGCAAVAAGVFLVSPRTERSQFAASLTRPAGPREAGFSTTVQLDGGSIGDGSPEPVLNLSVTLGGENIGDAGTPWLVRGSALDHYEVPSRTWVRSLNRSRDDITIHNADRGASLASRRRGTTVRTEVTLRRTAEKTIFTPAPVDGPVAIAWIQTPALPRIVFGRDDQQLIASSPMDSVHTYTTETWLAGAPDPRPDYAELTAHRRDGGRGPRRPTPEMLHPDGERPGTGDNRPGPDPLLLWTEERESVHQFATDILQRQGLPTDLSGSDPATRLEAGRALAHYLRQNFRYTTSNPATGDRDPVAAFLFRQQRGHCELFASGLCAMCRVVGIPARVVTGFRASEFNDIGGYYVVRQQHAHAWTEIDLGPGGGWHTLDATPPEDVDREHQTDAGWLAGVRDLYDHFEFKWIATVITFDQHTQEQILGGMGAFVTEGPDRWAGSLTGWVDDQADEVELDTFGYLSLGLIGVALAIAVFSLLRLLIVRHRRMVALQLTALPRAQRRGLARQLRFYIAMLETLERHGHVRPHWQSPYGFAQGLAEHDPMSFDPVVALTELFYEVRFGYRHLDAPRKERVKVHLRRLERALAGGPD